MDIRPNTDQLFEMDILPYHFGVCQIFGLWFEDSHYLIVRMMWRCIVLIILIIFNLSQITELLTGHGSFEETAEVLFTTFTFFLCLFKTFNFILRYNEMCDLLEDFRMPLCQPMTEEERQICENYSFKVKTVYLFYLTLSHSCGLTILGTGLLSYFKHEYNMPFKVYQPYDITVHHYYWISYSIQLFAIIVGVTLNVTMDAIAYSFIILVTCQYEIISSRYRNFTMSTKDCIEHQVLLQNVVLKIQDFYVVVILPLFSTSLITLCVSIFHISQINIASFEFLSMILYLSCMLSLIFLYCWFGNELNLKSKDIVNTIYDSSWLELDNPEKKNLWLAMISAKNGCNISFHGQSELSLNTFIWIVKTSYATFNLLKQAL